MSSKQWNKRYYESNQVISKIEEIHFKKMPKNITSQEGGFFNFLRPLITTGLPLMKNIVTPLAKSFLVPL